MDDLISRQAAIDALGEKPLVWDDLSDFDLGKAAQWSDDVDAIKELPSAQPQHNVRFSDADHVWIDGKQYISLQRFGKAIKDAQPETIRCKDCEWWTKQKDSLQGRCALMQMYPTGGVVLRKRTQKGKMMSKRLIYEEDAIEWVENILEVDKYYHPHAKSRNVPIDEVIDRLKRVPSAQPQWISVTERLPERGKDVLVTRDYDGRADHIKSCRYVEVASCYGEDDDVSWNSYSDEYKMTPKNHRVVAWMPLPDPCKGE